MSAVHRDWADTEAGKAAGPGVFEHVPRPAYVPSSHPKQRYFGATYHEAVNGVGNSLFASKTSGQVGVFRQAGLPTAELSISSVCVERLSAVLGVDLSPHVMREVARCLVDAAHDIEVNP